MKISKQTRRDAKQLFQGCKVNGLVDESKVRRTIEAVISKKPRGYVGMLSHMQRLLKIDQDRRTARVESAIPLNGAMEASLRANLAQRYGPGLNVSFSQNPALIGGLRVQVGSDVFDGSIQARLNSLAESF